MYSDEFRYKGRLPAGIQEPDTTEDETSEDVPKVELPSVRRKQYRSRLTETDTVDIARIHDVATCLFRVRLRLSRGSAEETTHTT